MSTNIWTITGNLGKDVEVKEFEKGSVANFSVAVSSGFGDRKKTHWVNVAAWGKQGEACAKYLSKGKKVLVCGELDVREWTDKGDNTRHSLELTAREVEFLSSKDEARPVTKQSDTGLDGTDIPF